MEIHRINNLFQKESKIIIKVILNYVKNELGENSMKMIKVYFDEFVSEQCYETPFDLIIERILTNALEDDIQNFKIGNYISPVLIQLLSICLANYDSNFKKYETLYEIRV